MVVSGAAFATLFGEAFDGSNAAARAEYVKKGKITIQQADAATLAAWEKAAAPAVEAWLAADPDRAALLEAYRAALAE